jgi:hypothetical protein
LYYWYISNILESIYFKKLKIEDHGAWKIAFENSDSFQQFITMYEQYLSTILANGPSHYQLNTDLEISIIESLGKVARNQFDEIPCLLSSNFELSVLTPIDSRFQHVQPAILNFIPQLGELCTGICKGKLDQQIAENAVAIMLAIARSAR